MPQGQGLRFLHLGTSMHFQSRRHFACRATLALLFAASTISKASAANITLGDPVGVFDTQLVSLHLTGGPYSLPLGPGSSATQADLSLGLSNVMASVGKGYVYSLPGQQTLGGIQSGQSYLVKSVFDLFFDVTFTTAWLAKFGQPGLHQVSATNLGPAHMETTYILTATSGLNFGLVPPPATAPYTGQLSMRIAVGDGDGGNLTQFDFIGHIAGNSITGSDNTLHAFSSSGGALSGVITESLLDSPITFNTPGTASSTDPGAASGTVTSQGTLSAPEPGTLTLALLGVTSFFGYACRRGWKPALIRHATARRK
jgi:hypothetical protein